MTAAVRNLSDVEQGATYHFGFTWHRADPDNPGSPGDPYDLTGCTARMQIRKKVGEPVLVSATSLNSGDGAGRIVLGGVTGRIDVTLTDQDTMLLTEKKAVYDLEIEWPIQAGELRPRVDRLLQGQVLVEPNVTVDS
jgi:hypothetical protein